MLMYRILYAFLFLGSFAVMVAAQSTATIQVDITDPRGPMNISRFGLGQGGFAKEQAFNHRTAEIRMLKPAVIRLFLQEYYDLLPAPGKYHFSYLDAPIDDILATGAKPLLCITFKPKILFPKIDQDLTEPNSWTAWEDLVYHLVSHYKQRNGGGWYWEIGNEVDLPSGGGTPYHFSPETYIKFYEHTVKAIRRADPSAYVGGPALAHNKYPILEALLAFCDRNHFPLDFVSWHGYTNDPTWYRRTLDQVHGLLEKYPSIHPKTVIDEWNIALGMPSPDPRFQPAFIAETTYQMDEGGLDLSCYYHIRDYPFAEDQFLKFYPEKMTYEQTIFWDRRSIYLGLFDYTEQARPAYYVFRMLEALTGDRLKVGSDSSTVHSLASVDLKRGTATVMIWNYSDRPTNVTLLLKGLSKDIKAWRSVLNINNLNDDAQRLHAEPRVQVRKDDGKIAFPLDAWGITEISLPL